MSAKDDIARRQAEAKFKLGEQREADAVARKKAALAHESLMRRIAEQRELRLAREAETRALADTTLSS